ncbi:MAG: hypothetical protein ACI4QM_00035, partial [Alphaproteobacteria bacterium]
TFNDFFEYLNGAHLIQTDIRQMSALLTPAQKEQLYLLLNFDKAAYEQQIAGKKVDFFALRNLYSSETEQINTVLHLFKNLPADHILVLKDHPSLATRKIAQKIKKNIPSALILPHEQPFEILVIADLLPDTVSGYPSSIFFSVPDEKILYYVTADRDYYLNFLKVLHKIPDGKVFHSLKGDQ